MVTLFVLVHKLSTRLGLEIGRGRGLARDGLTVERLELATSTTTTRTTIALSLLLHHGHTTKKAKGRAHKGRQIFVQLFRTSQLSFYVCNQQ